jgi:AcrR family transcriptional regulator
MARLPDARDTHLTPAEIAAETLRQFDEAATEPSIRSLATALHVAPTAIYHHFPSRAAVVQAAVELVWGEAIAETLRLVPAPFEADPIDVLIEAGVATRRAWLTHHRVARYMAATPEATASIATALTLISDLFARLGLEGERVAASFHGYSSFMIGAVLFAADRKTANDELEAGRPADDHIYGVTAPAASGENDQTRRVIDEVMDLSTVDPARDEQLFRDGLRRLVESLVAVRDQGG